MTDEPETLATPATPGSWRAGLEHRQIRFVEEYLVDLNATQAVIRSGYNVTTNDSARSIGSQNLRKPAVAEAIAKALSERWGVTKARIVEEYASIAFARMDRVAKWGRGGVTLLESEDLTAEDLAAVSEVSETITKDGGSKRIKLHDKPAALLALGKVVGLFTDKHEVSGPGGEPLMPEASDRDVARAVLDILRSASVADASAEAE